MPAGPRSRSAGVIFVNIFEAAFAPVDLCCFFGMWRRVYSIKVGYNFKLCALVELGTILLVKVNGDFYAKYPVGKIYPLISRNTLIIL